MKKIYTRFIQTLVLASLCSSPSFAAVSVSQLVSQLNESVMNSDASSTGKSRVSSILNQCSTQATATALCSCLNENLPSRAHKVVNRCYTLSASSTN